MNREFFQDKIIKLSDEKLVELLQTTNNEFNKEAFQLATEEASKRNLTYDLTKPVKQIVEPGDQNDPQNLKKWNWGAFTFAPVWGLVYKLQWLAAISFIPIVGFFIGLYFGAKGNRMAFQKNNTLSISDFMTIQNKWNYWGKVYFWLLVACVGVLAIIFFDRPELLYKEGEQPFKN